MSNQTTGRDQKPNKLRYLRNWKTLHYFCTSEQGNEIRVCGVKKKDTDIWVGGRVRMVSIDTPPLRYYCGKIPVWHSDGAEDGEDRIWWKISRDPAALKRFRRNATAVAAYSRTHNDGVPLYEYEAARSAKKLRIRMFMFVMVICVGVLCGAAFFFTHDGTLVKHKGLPMIIASNAGNSLEGGNGQSD